MAGRFSIEAVFKAVDKLTAPVTRMQNRVGKFTRGIARGMKSVDKAVSGVVKSFGKGSATIAKGVGIASASIGTFVTLFNKATVESDLLAKSVQFNVDKLESIAGAIAPAGFQIDNVVDLIEEMNNKIGESAGLGSVTTPVAESMAILGLNIKDIIDLSPEKQFESIANAALAMEDAQKAAAAADILLGGEANKVIGVLRQQGKTIDEIIAKQEALNFRTDESRQGAMDFVMQLQLMTKGLTSLGSEISGLIGKRMAPLIKKITEWAAANKELISEKISDFINSAANSIKFLIDNFDEISGRAKKVGAWIAAFIAFSVVLKTLVGIMTLVNLVMAANPVGLIVIGIFALIAAVAALIIWWDDLYAAFKKMNIIDSVVGALSSLQKAFADTSIIVDATIAGLALMSGPIGWLIGAALLIVKHWEPISEFFSNMWSGIVSEFTWAADKVEGIISGFKGAFSFSSDVNDNSASGNGSGAQSVSPVIVSPQQRIAGGISEKINTNKSEVTIKDETGRAQLTDGVFGNGLTLESSGAM